MQDEHKNKFGVNDNPVSADTGGDVMTGVEGDTTSSTYRPRVHAPRPLWYDAVLGAVTMTASFCFWMVGRVRDVKQMRSNSTEPWLWFFVPLVTIAQPFAFARLFGELRAVEGDRLNHPWKYLGWLWVLLLVMSGILATLADRDILPNWVFIAGMAVAWVLFCLLHLRFNALKHHDAALLEFHGRRSGYYWWEWLLMVFFIVIWCVLALVYWDEKQSIIKELPGKYEVVDTNAKYQFTIQGKGWRQVAVGTYSDGSTEIEFGDTDANSYLLIFDHGIDSTLNSVASFRYGDVQDDFSVKPECREQRQLSEDEKSVHSVSICHVEKRAEHALSASKLIDVDGRLYELLGYTHGEPITYRKDKATLLKAIETFSKLNEGAKQ